jgi:hypothetical protein
MAKYLMLALNGPTKGEGDEDTFNRWYDETHVPDFKAIDGIKTARRFRMIRSHKLPQPENWPYITVYEIETDDFAAVQKRIGTEVGPTHETFDTSTSAAIWAVQISGDD